MDIQILYNDLSKLLDPNMWLHCSKQEYDVPLSLSQADAPAFLLKAHIPEQNK
jgi:hypothetical protein